MSLFRRKYRRLTKKESEELGAAIKRGQVFEHPDVRRAALKGRLKKKRSNPTKAQKRLNAKRAARKRSIAKSVRALLKKANPSAKITGAEVVKLKGGALRITPIKSNRGRR